MDQLFSHIEFLLHDHNCVIVPGFGGFVVNAVPSRKEGLSTFVAPSCELAFNRDLAHNDGLLAQSYMRGTGLTFEAAMLRVDEDVRALKRRLMEERRVEMGRLGTFAMHDEKRFVYTPGAFVRPDLFGLSPARLKPLIQMTPSLPVKEEGRKRVSSHRSGSVAAAAAAVLLLMLLLPLGDGHLVRQSARMGSEAGWMYSKSKQPERALADMAVSDVATPATNVAPVPEGAADSPAVDGASGAVVSETPKYYIVMGVYRGIVSAEKTLQLLREEGFHQSGKLERTDRFDVYAASFTDENAARVYLKEVHQKFPGHADAWILKR